MTMTSSWADVFPYPEWGGNWTPQENKCFEKALAFFDKDTPGRWQRVADMIPGKTVVDVISHYNDLEEDVRHIEEGLVPFPGYDDVSPFTFDWDSDYTHGIDHQPYLVGGKRSAAAAAGRPDHERKKGVPWTEEEHRLFLMGLKKYGKGDWRSISRNYVVSRTPTQVASHAQKYFIRLNSGSKDKRRSSIHDITTVNLPDVNGLPSPPAASQQPGNPDQVSAAAVVDSIKESEAAASTSVYSSPSPSAHNNRFIQQPYGLMDSYRMKLLQSQHLDRGALHGGSMVAHHGMLYQMQAVQPHLHG